MKKLTYEYVKNFIELQSYKLLSKKYKGDHTKLEVQCPKKHIYEVTWANFRQGYKCPVCGGTQKLTYEYIKEKIERKGYKLLSREYKNNYTKLKTQCPKGHIFEITWTHFQQRHGCPICWANSFSSKTEKEISKIIENQGIKIKRNDRTQITNPLTGNKLELDIFMPTLNKAVEYNGEYWHSFKETIGRDKIKLQECAKVGIKLLVIKEQDWIDNKTDCVDKIKNFVKDKTLLLSSEIV